MFRRSAVSRRPRPFCQLNFERLEDRSTPAIFFVTNTDDAGAGSLRQAVIDANNQVSPSPDTILFQTQGTIVLTTGQILIDDPVNITGPGSGNLIISGNNASRIFFVGDDISTSIHVALSGMTLLSGDALGGRGGAIQVENEDLQLNDVVVTGNRARRGAGIDIGIDGRLTMDKSVVSGNIAQAPINVQGGPDGGPTNGLGGGIYLDGFSVAIIRDSTISGNSTTNGNGAGIYVEYGSTLFMQRSYMAFNNATGGSASGGGIFCFDDGQLTIEDSTIANNSAAGTGGGIDAGTTAFRLVNSTISGNFAGTDGGGIYIDYYYGGGKRPGGEGQQGPAPAVIIAATITGNTANSNGGGIYTLRDVTATNSIISSNNATADDDISSSDAAYTLNFSLVQNKGGATVNDGGGNIFNVAALLGFLQDNGGPTPTHQLLCGSPGIHAGNNAFGDLLFDQRGFPRIAGTNQDMGAVELEFGCVQGTAFVDANGDGVFNAGDTGFDNVFVWLDANGNRSPDNEEVWGRTNPDGTYELLALPGDYNVLAELPAGWQRTNGDPGFAFVSAGDISAPFDFGYELVAGIDFSSGAGFSPFQIQGAVDEYRALLGALNPNVGGTQNNGNGRREINWDGVPDNKAAPNNLPANFFNTNSPRGAVFSTQGTGFQVSSNFVGDGAFNNHRFGNLNDAYPNIFQTFSAQRLFTPLGSTVYDVTFFVPGTTTPATVMGFGAVFVETDNPVQSSMEFFDINGNSLGIFYVPRAERQQMEKGPDGVNGNDSGALAFVGIKFTDGRRAASVRITTGNAEIGANDNNLSHDVVVLDDFIYGEPVAAVAPPPEPGPVVKITAIGSGPGGNSRVNVYDTSGKQIGGFNAFDISFRGEVHVSTADIDNDGFEDVITAAGPGGGPHVQVWGGKKLIETGIAERIVSPLGSFFTFDPRFQGGVFVAAGDVNGDGRQDIICAAGPGGGPHVIAFSGADATVLTSFYAYDIGFMGGVSVAASDFTGDGRADIATGAGPGGGPHVRIFNPNNGNSIFREFFAYGAGFLGGVYVGAGDLNGDNLADIVTGAGQGGGPHVVARDGQTLNVITQFFAYESIFPGGVRVSVADWDGDNDMDILCGAGPLGGPHFRAVDKDGNQLDSFYALFDKDFPGGIFVG